MGKKAKKRKERKGEDPSTVLRSHCDSEAQKKVREMLASPDYELMYMDQYVPIWVFCNKETMEFTSIGHRPAVMAMGEAFDRAIEETRREAADKASLN